LSANTRRIVLAMDDSPAERRRAVAIAGHRGDVATARAHLADTDPRVRATALGALSRCDALASDDVRAAMRDPHPAVRRRAAELGARHIEVSLLALLEDPDPLVVEAAAWATGERVPAEPGAVEALARVATSASDPLCREAAVAALGAIGDEAGLDAILHGCTDKPAVRRRAVLALAPFDGDRVRAALHAARTDRDWQVRQAAEDLLAIAEGEG
jgi:HEAT repeat protein